MKLRDQIIRTMRDIAEMQGRFLVEELHDDTILLDSGLDSLGFAILVARLEEDLGYDPFTLMKDPFYPRTLSDLVGVYERYRP